MKLNDLKRRHNALLKEGQAAYAQMLETHAEVISLQDRIKEIEGDDYDPIPVLFGGGFYIHEEDE